MEASALSHPVGLGRLSVAGPLLRLRSDDQLVALFRAGHDEAFGTIHDRYRQRLFAYSRQMLGGSSSDAEDVLQDVFLRAYDALRVDGREVLLRAWLYRVAHNRCIDHLRRPAPAPSDIYDLNRGPQQDPMAEAERREELRRLVADVRRLPEQQRSALLMREMEGLSYNELAAALDVTVPAVKSLLVRARVGLVEAIEARDTGCAEIRTDLAAAFDRGVRASGRSRRHLRECTGCRDYRSALRHVEKQLNGLAPSGGPLTALAKVLGIGGSGAAAGGSVVGAGGGAAAVSSGAATIGGGAAAATAGKVAAVMAAAAVVGGGAATVENNVEHHPESARAAQVAPVVRHAPAAMPARPRHAGPLSLPHPHRPLTVHGPTKAPPSVAHLVQRTVESSAGAGAGPAYEATTGGLEAPAETPASTEDSAPTVDGMPGSDAAAQTPGGSAPAPGPGPEATGSAPAGPGTGGTRGPPSSSGSSSSGPSGQVSGPAGAPVAQGATATAPGG